MAELKPLFPTRWSQLAGLPTALYTAEQVRELDRRAIAAGVAGIELMSRAARAAFVLLTRRWPQARRVRVYCGTGNNGGDGYLLASFALEQNFQVQLVEVNARGHDGLLQGDAALARQQLLTSADQMKPGAAKFELLSQLDLVGANTSVPDVIVDALLGTGVVGELKSEYQIAIEQINQTPASVLAIDIPSGIETDTGYALGGLAVRADATLSFIGMKRGLLTGDAVDYCGEIHFASLKVDREILDILSKEGRLPVADLARRIGLSKTPCQVRLKRLQERQYIVGFRAVLNPQKLGQEHVAFAEVKLSDTREKALNEFNTAIQSIPEIEQCHMIAGSFDYLLKIRSSDIQTYRRILGETISMLPHVANTSTFVAMQSVKDFAY